MWYRLASVPLSHDQQLHAALVWAGPRAVGAARSAAEQYGVAGVRAERAEIVVPRRIRPRSDVVVVHQCDNRAALMVRTVNGFPVTGVEATVVALAQVLDEEALETACADLRRRRLTTVPALRAYVARFGRKGRRGTTASSRLLRELEKWSVPGRLGYRIVFATWQKVVSRPEEFVEEVRTALRTSS